MADFETALLEGLRAYQDAERARAEIDQVIEEFSIQIRRASGNAISDVKIERREGSGVDVFMAIPGTRVRTYKALVASGRAGADQSAPDRELCEIQIASDGYPVRLEFADKDIHCHDRISLEQALGDLLRHPDTGAKIAQLMSESAA